MMPPILFLEVHEGDLRETRIGAGDGGELIEHDSGFNRIRDYGRYLHHACM